MIDNFALLMTHAGLLIVIFYMLRSEKADKNKDKE